MTDAFSKLTEVVALPYQKAETTFPSLNGQDNLVSLPTQNYYCR